MPERDRWTNAIIEITIPLDVPVDADPYAKQQAVAGACDLFELPPNACACGRWEDVKSDPRGGTIPLAPAPGGEGGGISDEAFAALRSEIPLEYHDPLIRRGLERALAIERRKLEAWLTDIATLSRIGLALNRVRFPSDKRDFPQLPQYKQQALLWDAEKIAKALIAYSCGRAFYEKEPSDA